MFAAGTTSREAVADGTWKQCAVEGDNCYLQSGSWAVRFGYGGDGDSYYYYTVYNDNDSITVPCTTDHFGDPRRGKDKVCQYRPVYDSPGQDYLGCSSLGTGKQCGYQTDNTVTWSECATEGNDCKVDTKGLVALRYGSYESNQWAQRNWSSTGSAMECSNHAWGYDPAKGHDKVCEYGNLPEYAMRAVSYQWKKIEGTCDNCSDPIVTTTVGVDISEGTSTTTGFSASVAEQVSAQVNIGLGVSSTEVGATLGVQYTATVGANWSRTVSSTTSVSESIQEQFTCTFSSVPANHNVLVYQFVSSSYRIGAGNVDVGDIQDSSFACILTPQGQPPLVPACLPNYFDTSDPTGQTCLEGGQLPTAG